MHIKIGTAFDRRKFDPVLVWKKDHVQAQPVDELLGDFPERPRDDADVKKMLGVTLVSEKTEDGPRRYRIEAAAE